MSNGVAAPVACAWIGLPMLSVGLAVVISADLTSIGDQSGCLAISSAAMPVMCGVAIEVPDSLSHRLPEWFAGETAATMSTPGAMMSGLPRSPPLKSDGPRDEKSATTGASGVGAPTTGLSAAVAELPAETMYDLIARPFVLLICEVGTKWKSATDDCPSVAL